LSRSCIEKAGEKTFIRVSWPGYHIDDITQQIVAKKDQVKRICISMITNKRAVQDTKLICRHLRSNIDIPISLLVAPTIISYSDLLDFKHEGADKIGVAVDLATQELFMKYRGRGKGMPHQWARYWQCLEDAIQIFGKDMAGTHFMVGMGETERQMAIALQKTKDMGGNNHLFSFFPEVNSDMEHFPLPPMDQYRRIQIARYLIDMELTHERQFCYDNRERIINFGIPPKRLDEVIDTGEPFRTSGCTGNDGQVACNRPFGNSRPGPEIRNYPFLPDSSDIKHIRNQFI
jgi:biotin synthase